MLSYIWFSDVLCVLRLAGDFCILASSPWLLYRIRKDGTSGISVETQILRLIMLFARYLDLFVYGVVISPYNTIMKMAVVVTSLHVVTSLIFQHKAYTLADLRDKSYRLCLPLLLAACLAPLCAYRPTFDELAWSFSQFLGAVADIPQLILFMRPENRDRKMKVYIGLLVGYRVWYIPHSILRSLTWGMWDPVFLITGGFETVIFILAFGRILLSNYRLRSQPQEPEDGLADSSASAPTSIVADYPQDSKIPPQA